MKLIDLYVSEVGRRLPKKTRSDIEAEIRSSLEDMLEERSQKTGKPVDDALAIAVLQELGAPEKVAGSYLGERYLIGPQLYPTFTLVLKIVLSAFGILALIGLGIELTHSGLTALHLLDGIAGVASALIAALGNVVLVFGIIEWALRSQGSTIQTGRREKPWDPRSLEKISPPNQVKLGEGITEIVLDTLAIAIFNFYPQLIGFTSSLNSVVENGSWSSVEFMPLFTDLFFSRFVPGLTVLWGLDILVNLLVLRSGTWKPAWRLSNIALRIGAITIGVVILATPGLLALTPEAIASAGVLDTATSALLATMARQGFASVLIVVMLFEGIELVRHLRKLIVGNK